MRNKICYSYKGSNKNHIVTKVLVKAPKGFYKNDIISLDIKGEKESFVKFMTPYEAMNIATGLMLAVMQSKEIGKGKVLR